MAIELTDEFNRIQASISGDSAPLGVCPSQNDFNSPTVQLRFACQDALRAEKQGGLEGMAAALPHWQRAEQLAKEILMEHCKDFQTVAQLTMALARTEGAAGIAFGYQTAARFATQWWDAFLAQWNDHANWKVNVSNNLKPFDDLNSTLKRPIGRLRITEDGFTVWQYHRAASLESETDPEVRQRRIQQGDVEKSVIMRSVEASSPEFYRQLLGDLEACQKAIKTFDEVFFQKLKEIDLVAAAPGTSEVREQIDDALSLVREISPTPPESPMEPELMPGNNDSSTIEVRTGPSGTPRTRKEALQLLETAAQFFDRTEPQSFLPPMIRWVREQGGLSPRDFFEKLIRDNELRRLLSRMVGIDPDSTADSE